MPEHRPCVARSPACGLSLKLLCSFGTHEDIYLHTLEEQRWLQRRQRAHKYEHCSFPRNRKSFQRGKVRGKPGRHPGFLGLFRSNAHCKLGFRAVLAKDCDSQKHNRSFAPAVIKRASRCSIKYKKFVFYKIIAFLVE